MASNAWQLVGRLNPEVFKRVAACRNGTAVRENRLLLIKMVHMKRLQREDVWGHYEEIKLPSRGYFSAM